MSTVRPEAAHQGHHAPGGWRGVYLCCLGMRGEGGPAVGEGRRREPQAMKVEGIFGHAHVAYLIDRGRAPLLLI